MLDQLHLRTRLRRAGPIAAVLLTAVVLVPSASSGTYADPSGDNVGAAGDLGAVAVSSDKTSGQILFTIAGANLASSESNVLFVDIDTDANPLTGSINDSGAEFEFMVDNNSYGFSHWDGSQWVDAPYSTVRVTSNPNRVTISVNRSELGNTTDFNFVGTSFSLTFSGNVPVIGLDVAPNDGAYNYSLQANGPQVNSADLQTTPSAGPKAGKRFTVVPTALHLPPDGRTIPATILPESYSCSSSLGAKKLAGSGTGGCTVSIPKKKARGKKLTVQLTVNYEGAATVLPFTFKVG